VHRGEHGNQQGRHGDEGFAAWVSRAVRMADPAEGIGAGMAHCTHRWIVEDGRACGAIALGTN
jgi:hypothetical protein